MNIAITGTTGLVGRNLLFELVKQSYNNLFDVKLILFGRNKKSYSFQQRILDIFNNELYDYIGDNKIDRSLINQWATENITTINYILENDDLNISADDLKKLQLSKIDHFIHVAALTDFRNTEKAKVNLKKINIDGTKNILNLIKNIDVEAFSYVSSAYVCGKTYGEIKPDFIKLNQEFRNYYEETKIQAEINVVKFCQKNKINFKVFRPSTIAGRLIEKPIGAVSKIDVFYHWLYFFHRFKQSRLDKRDCLNDEFNIDLRFYHGNEGGLNIVPCDYVAKVIYYGCFKDDRPDEKFYHAVNNAETPHKLYTDIMLKTINITGVEHVNTMPTNLNLAEKLYYATVGLIYTPYIIDKEMKFDNSNVKYLEEKFGFSCPKVDEASFSYLMKYVVDKNFKIDL